MRAEALRARLVVRAKAAQCTRDPARTPDRCRQLLQELEKIRTKGHAFSVNLVTPGAGVAALALPKLAESDQPLVICVAGLTDTLIAQEADLADLMAKAIAFHCDN